MLFPLLLLAATAPSAIVESEAGLSASHKKIPVLYGSGALDYASPKIRLLIVAGLDGTEAAAQQSRNQLTWFETSPQARRYRDRFSLSVIPLANPDRAALRFPPTGTAYADNAESHYLWRFFEVYAPDLILTASPIELPSLPTRLLAGELPPLLAELTTNPPAVSSAHSGMLRRLNRTPGQVAGELALRYGHELPQAVYIPAFALIGRLRLGHLADVEKIVAPYANGTKNSLEKATSSHLSGHLVFAELARLTRNPRYTELVRAAANLAFDEAGRPKDAMPLHNEMSDSVFMGTTILAQAGHLSGDGKYFDMALRHLRFMQKLCLRADGLYRHSPLDEAAWGRGNAFPALGLALTLSVFPKTHSGYREILASFQRHMEALARNQEATGTWRQVIDYPGSYRELSATCMIGTAMLLGVRQGWLPRSKFQPLVNRAWTATKLRVSPEGHLIDVCTSTGKQKTLADYLHRAAIHGPDPRGGAMALIFATEMAGARQPR